jgi:hypothetical protein
MNSPSMIVFNRVVYLSPIISFACKSSKELCSLRLVGANWEETINFFCEVAWTKALTEDNVIALASIGNIRLLRYVYSREDIDFSLAMISSAHSKQMSCLGCLIREKLLDCRKIACKEMCTGDDWSCIDNGWAESHSRKHRFDLALVAIFTLGTFDMVKFIYETGYNKYFFYNERLMSELIPYLAKTGHKFDRSDILDAFKRRSFVTIEALVEAGANFSSVWNAIESSLLKDIVTADQDYDYTLQVLSYLESKGAKADQYFVKTCINHDIGLLMPFVKRKTFSQVLQIIRRITKGCYDNSYINLIAIELFA